MDRDRDRDREGWYEDFSLRVLFLPFFFLFFLGGRFRFAGICMEFYVVSHVCMYTYNTYVRTIRTYVRT